MAARPTDVTLQLTPSQRVDVIDVNEAIREQQGDLLADYGRALYCSFHTTAGYLEQRLAERLGDDPERVADFLSPFQRLFPEGADYVHDRMELRNELTEDQKVVEPRNADSHLTFIGSGLESCATYRDNGHKLADRPVYFIDLDGVNVACGGEARSRRTRVVAFNEEREIERVAIDVPLTGHPIESLNLRDPRLGVYSQIEDALARLGVGHGRVELRLAPDERHAGLTVNEFETLLMRHDLAEVLQNPMRYMAEKAGAVLSVESLRHPRRLASKAKDYAKYDLVQLVNESMERMGLRESLIERVVDKFLRLPASRFLRMKRQVTLLVGEENGHTQIIHGRYQSPILVHWQRHDAAVRRLEASIIAFE